MLDAAKLHDHACGTRPHVVLRPITVVHYTAFGNDMIDSSEFQRDIALATEILLAEGCKEIYLFGSVARGSTTSTSDIDIATVGLPKEKFFKAYGTLLSKLHRHVDLVGLDFDTDFGQQLKETGVLTRVA